ncbi:MAG: hypothetical protein U0744_15110 [Gemmataceae bacterium]
MTEAIRGRDQARAAALVHRYGNRSADAPLWDALREPAISQDGALHHEKFYRTTVEEFQAARQRFKWALRDRPARVTASGYGYPALGNADARRLLGL